MCRKPSEHVAAGAQDRSEASFVAEPDNSLLDRRLGHRVLRRQGHRAGESLARLPFASVEPAAKVSRDLRPHGYGTVKIHDPSVRVDAFVCYRVTAIPRKVEALNCHQAGTLAGA